MPLIKSKSKEAFAKNVKAELAAGKPLKQSLAIAYATKRQSHSSHSQKRSEHYHSKVVKGTPIEHGATKMTRQAAVRGKDDEDRWV